MQHQSGSLDSTFLAQATNLRALAWGLLGDEHAADDVVQETWLTSAKRELSPDGEGGNLGAWLKKVAANLSRNKRRATRSRQLHEQRAACLDEWAPTDETAAQRELVRHLIEAVSNLEDPYQSVIIMRYYQELAPRHIALEQGVPVGTIKSQLHRGLEKLRERLDEHTNGERGHWAGMLFEAVGGSGAAQVPWQGLSMVKMAGAGLALLGGAWLLGSAALQPPAPNSPTPAMMLATEVEHENSNSKLIAMSPESAAADDQGTESNRVPVAKDLPLVPAFAPAPHLFDLRVELVDTGDQPMIGASIFLAPLGHPMNLVRRSDEDGVCEVKWRGTQQKMTMMVGIVRHGQIQTAIRQVEMQAGSETRLRLSIGSYEYARVTLPSPRAATGVTVEGEYRLKGLVLDRPSTRRLPREMFGAELDHSTGEVEFVFRYAPEPVVEDVEIMEQHETQRRLADLGYVGGDLAWGKPQSAPKSILISGKVTRADGQPAAGTFLRARSMMGTCIAVTGPEGEYEFQVPLAERIELSSGGGNLGIASKVVELDLAEAPAAYTWDPMLDRGFEISGSIEVASEVERKGWHLEVLVNDAHGIHADTTSGAKSEFALPNLPRGNARLLLSDAGSWPLAFESFEAFSPSSMDAGFEVDAQKLVRQRLDVAVLEADGTPSACEVLLLQEFSGRAHWMTFDKTAGVHRSLQVPTGSYHAWAGDAHRSYQDLGRFEVTAEEAAEIGPFKLDEGCAVQFLIDGQVPEMDDPRTWNVRRQFAGVSSKVGVEPSWEGDDLRLAAGLYSVALEGPDFTMPAIEVELTPFEKQVIDIPVSSMGSVHVSFEAPTEEKAASTSFTLLDAQLQSIYEGELPVGNATRIHLEAGQYWLESIHGRVGFEVEVGQETRP